MSRRRGLALCVALVLALAGAGFATLRATESPPPRGDAPPAAARPPSVAGPSPARTSGDLVVGVTANALDDDPVRQAGRVRRLGAGWMREELRWAEFEPRRGAFETGRFDRVMLAAAQDDLRVLPVLITTPSWLADKQLALPPDLGRWARFVRLAMRRYAPDGDFWRENPELDGRLAPRVWEVWNEPYLDLFSPPAPDPRAYADLVRATVRAGRSVDEGARFLVAAETVYTTAGGQRRDWLADLLSAMPDAPDVIDALSVHPYSPGSPLSRGPEPDARFDRLERLLRTLDTAGVGARPLWLTELGWTTCTARPPCVTPDEQGAYLAEAFDAIAERFSAAVEAVFVYRLIDIDAERPASYQSGFGVLNLRGARKPAAAVLQAAAGRTP